ncbi:TetR/AcrR family transcriptional regulator [Nocardia sp. NPDC059091]|uniref:TetR/AcrR family transcriptional regulator n=1 Tax=unclassified Nocardia TaxID=2637762 RepID=UPI0036CBE62B
MRVRNRLLDSTISLMQRKGVVGTSISEILDHSQASRRSLYVQFPCGKAELIDLATRRAGEQTHAYLETLATESEPHRMIDQIIEHWKQRLVNNDFGAGCPIAAAALARCETPTAADSAADIFGRWEQTLAHALVAHRVAPEDALALATTTFAAIEGAIVMSVAARSSAPLDRIRSQMTSLIGHYATTTAESVPSVGEMTKNPAVT